MNNSEVLQRPAVVTSIKILPATLILQNMIQCYRFKMCECKIEVAPH